MSIIATFTANPSIDKTVTLENPLARGAVQRAASTVEQAGGKGVNVARVTGRAGITSVAVLPFRDDGYLGLLESSKAAQVSIAAPDLKFRPRTNTAITEPDGTTTKINEAGPSLTPADLDAARTCLTAAAEGAAWVVLSGSLPPGAPADWYVGLCQAVKEHGCKVAIDTSEAALDAVIAALPEVPFDLIKPNSDELAQLTGGDAEAFEASAKAGDLDAIVAAAQQLRDRGITHVLVTLGGSGAVLVNAQGAWYSTAPTVEVKSTVGAGDSSVAGFIIAEVAGQTPDECLASAVAYGSAAAALPGTTLPTPKNAHPEQARVSKLA